MRRILVDFARSRRNAKRSGEAIQVTFEKALEAPGIPTRTGPRWTTR